MSHFFTDALANWFVFIIFSSYSSCEIGSVTRPLLELYCAIITVSLRIFAREENRFNTALFHKLSTKGCKLVDTKKSKFLQTLLGDQFRINITPPEYFKYTLLN